MILAVLISVGLALMPLSAANAMRMAPAAAMDQSLGAGVPGPEDCPCCDVATKCPMTSCAAQCVQVGPTAGSLLIAPLPGSATRIRLEPVSSDGLDRAPPTPPPRA
jgi:hypothetical protein